MCGMQNERGERCENTLPHAHCIQCGSTDSSGVGLCMHHQFMNHDQWASANRIACDFFHRGVEPPRVESEVVVDWTGTESYFG